jgi:hypothetical protein
MDLLAELNSLREIDGKVPLKKWTGTEDQLKYSILQRKKAQTPQKSEKELIAEYLARGGDVKYGRGANAKGVRRQGARRLGRKGKILDKPKLTAVASQKTTRATVIPSDCFHLTEISNEAGYQLRARARRHPELADLNVKELGRWVFRRSDWDRIVVLMRQRR